MKPKAETEQQRIVRHADIIIANANYKGELDNDCLDIIGALTKMELPPQLAEIRNELRSIQPTNINSEGTIDLEITKAFIQKNYDDVKNHLLDNGYISEPDFTRKWILTEKGKAAKEAGGHENYVANKKRELRAKRSDEDAKIYWWKREIWRYLIAGVIGLFFGYVLRIITEPKSIPVKNQTTILNKVDSTSQNKKR
jgi:hypothetical protein